MKNKNRTTLRELAERLSAKCGFSDKKAKQVLHAFFNSIGDAAMEGHKIIIRNFGSFSTKFIPSRKLDFMGARGRVSPKYMALRFKPGKGLKERVNGTL